MTEDVAKSQPLLSLLLLDDEQDILNALKRLLRKDYNIVTFTEGAEALAHLAEHNINIIMSDMRMPTMDGAEFLAKAREIQPESVRLLLTGFSDMESTIKAINEGGVYTYIGKPWDNQELKMVLANSSEKFVMKKETERLNSVVTDKNKELHLLNKQLEAKVLHRTEALLASKKKLKGTLNTQKDLLYDVLDMMSATIEYRTGLSSGHTKRVAAQCKAVAKELGLGELYCRRIYLCALLHEVGTVGLPDEVLSKGITGNKLDDAFGCHPSIGAEIIGKVKRFAGLTNNILHQNENMDGTGIPNHLSGEDIPIGARIIRVVKDFDFLIAGKMNEKRMSINHAHAWMNEKIDVWYDKRIVSAFKHILEHRDTEDDQMEYSVGVTSLKAGDKLVEDLVLSNGNVMLKEGHEINDVMIEKLRDYERNQNTTLTLFIG